MYKKNIRSWLKHFDFIVVDLICIQISMIIAYVLRNGFESPYLDVDYANLGIELIIIHLLLMFFTENYSGILKRGHLMELKAVLKYNIIFLAAVFAFMFLAKKSATYSRWMLIYFFFINIVFMLVSHILTKELLHLNLHNNKNRTHMLLVSKEALVHKTLERLTSNKFNSIIVDRVFIADMKHEISDVDGVMVLKTFDELLNYSKLHVVDEVFVDLYTNKELIHDITQKFQDMGITTHINLYQITNQGPNTIVENINGFTTLTTSVNIVSFRQLFIKRVIDIIAGSFGLIATLIAFVIFAPIIFIQSPGPIFFSQTRVGKNGRKFKIYKFRSMYKDAEERKKDLMAQNKVNGHMFKIDNDPRILPIGKFIRKLSIDELPQSINILFGDMSLVGTRPPTLDEYEKYELHHKKRLASKPGLTGLWQISGRSAITDFEEVVKLDTEYLATWSLSLDAKIIWRTIGVVVARSGAG